jgi:hypothetical protein
MGVWTFGRIENQKMGMGCSNSSAGAVSSGYSILTETLADDASGPPTAPDNSVAPSRECSPKMIDTFFR